MAEIMTIGELADYLRVHRKTVYRLLQQRAIPATKVGRQWRFEKASIDEWLKHRSTEYQAQILVVDDDNLIRTLFQEILSEMGHKVTPAKNSQEAIELVRQTDFDLAFLDLMLPGMDGAKLMAELKAIKSYLPIIIITAYPDSQVMSRALEQGPFSVMRKPFNADDISVALESVLPK